MLPRPDGTRSLHTADGGVILDIKSGKMFSLNGSASLIFQLLERGLSDREIVEQLVEHFAISADVAESDLAEFRKSLANHALLSAEQSRSGG
jgi:hypothetical protein